MKMPRVTGAFLLPFGVENDKLKKKERGSIGCSV
jgi:hypothetical protein